MAVNTRSSVIDRHLEEVGRHQKIERKLPPTSPTIYFRWKGVGDRCIAAILVVPISVLIAALVIVIRMTSRGPGIFRQQRVGKDGKLFTMLKLRSMYVDAEDEVGAVWANEDDPRTTFVGRILRKFHLDELPQIYNVLRGEMAFVGPRPERPEFVQVLTVALPEYRDRLLVQPGITGLAQINLPPDTDLPGVAKKLAIDLEYIETAGMGLDIRLLLCTLARTIRFRHDAWIGLFGVRRDICGHDKFVAPDQRWLSGNGRPFSAAELRRLIFQHYPGDIDLQQSSEYELLVGSGNGHKPSNGNGNGHKPVNGNGHKPVNGNGHKPVNGNGHKPVNGNGPKPVNGSERVPDSHHDKLTSDQDDDASRGVELVRRHPR